MILVEKPEGKIQLQDYRRCENNIKMNLKEIILEVRAQNRVILGWAVVNTVTNHVFSQDLGILLDYEL